MIDVSRRTIIKSKLALGALTFASPFVGSKALFGRETLDSLKPSVWVTVFADGKVEIAVAKAEMGQGVFSNLPLIVADEMEANWDNVAIKMVGEAGEYLVPGGFFAGTFGSTSVRFGYNRFRALGAGIRQLFIEAAARKLSLDTIQLKAEQGFIVATNGQKLAYGELLEFARDLLPLKEDAPLKEPKDFKLIGKSIPRKDVPDKIAGKAKYGIDASLPGMLYGAVKHNPVFGSRITNFTELENQKPAGTTLVEVPNGIVLVADSYWRAERGLSALRIAYDVPAGTEAISDQYIAEQLREQLKSPGPIVESEGQIVGEDSDWFEAVYEVPFLAHACMEPMSALASVTNNSAYLEVPTQSALLCQQSVAAALSMSPDSVEVQPTFLGGGFGRKAETDFVVEAALASKKAGKPVKLIWSRAEDIQHDFYRPAFAAKMRAVLKDGKVSSWQAMSAGSSPLIQRNPNQPFDPLSIDGFVDLLYDIPNREIGFKNYDEGIPVGFWRSVGLSQNCFFVESFLDELAERNGVDGLQLRRSMLSQDGPALALLDELDQMSGWSQDSTLKGIAICRSHGAYIGAVAHLSAQGSDRWVVRHLDAVIDVGVAVNPENIKGQVRGGMLYGLVAALYADLPIDKGRVQFDNFFQSTNLRLSNAPTMSVKVNENLNVMGGAGEPGTAVIAPAVASAFRRASGQVVRQLPIAKLGIVGR